jgi:hypothetical protein
MRKVAVLMAVLGTAVFSIVGVAYAVEKTQYLETKTTGKKGTKAKPRAIKLRVNLGVSANVPVENGTFATSQATISLDKNLKFNNTKFPFCTEQTVLTNEARCPAASKVGTGTVSAVAGPAGNIKVAPTVTAYNARGGKLLLKLTKAPGDPVDSTGVIIGTLKNATGKFGKKLDVPIPAKYQQQLGLFITLQKFDVTINKTYRKVPFVVSTGCTGGKYNFAGSYAYTDATTFQNTATSKC